MRSQPIPRTALLVAALFVAGSCGHSRSKLEPEARQAVRASRGLCPTDLHHTQMIVVDGGETISVGFRTNDPSKVEELSRRAVEMGEALSLVHPAINSQGQLIQHTPAPKPGLREMATSAGYGVELVFRPAPDRKAALTRNLSDHEQMWRRGECPVMTDESVRSGETKGWTKVDR